MGLLELEDFRIKHQSPACEIVEVTSAVNSSDIDPTSGDLKPIFVEVPFCKTHNAKVDPSSLVSKADLGSSDL